MSTPSEHNALHLRTMDELASIALGESADPTLTQHLRSCPECGDELNALQRVVDLARVSDPSQDVAPPPHVWDRIAAQTAPPVASVSPLPRSTRSRRYLLMAVAAAVVIGAGAGGWAVGHNSARQTVARASQAPLVAQPGTRDDAHGLATLHRSSAGYQLEVRAYKLPAHDGYFEVWLYNPGIGRMVAVGTLGTGGRGSFTVPGGIDLHDYRIVDVSAQQYNGNPAHDRSVLRGPLQG
ncbi:MAG: anti-sigma factor [Jatrophihabitans sp.]